MNKQKDRILWADRLRVGLIVVLLLLAMLARAKAAPVFLMFGMLALVVLGAVEFLMNRCPCCGRYLDRNWGHFCQHCGERIREEKADT